MSEPKVLFVNHTSTISGAEMVLLDVAPAFRNASAFMFEEGALNIALAQKGINVIASRFGKGLSKIKRDSRLAAAAPLAGRMTALVGELSAAARNYDVIYANSQKAFVIGSIAAAMARRPLIWHLHDIVSKAHFGAGQRRLQILLANSFARSVLAPSAAVKTTFVSEGGRSELAHVVPNGLAIDVDPMPRSLLRRRLDLPQGPLIGVFSRLAPWKGQHIVLRALAELPDVSCIVVGSALFGEDGYSDCLKTLAENLKLGDRVIFLGQRSDVSLLMQAVDVVVHPSVEPEPFGRTLVEAMLVGTPVIATNAGAASEILPEDTSSNLLIPPGNSQALAEAVRTILASPPSLVGALAKAQQRARTLYGVDTMRSAIAKVVDMVASGPRQ